MARTETVAINLIESNIVVDSILLGDVDNHTLHGISNATGRASPFLSHQPLSKHSIYSMY
jgi:hypothetical protein